MVEAVAVAFGVAYVLLAIREIPWCWPAGIVNVAIYAVVFFHARLYGAAVLQLVYVVVSFYGWHAWLHGGDGHGRLRVSRTPARWAAGLTLAGILASIGLGLFLESRTDDALPFPDGATTAFSLVAQWMTTRKWLENWLVWIAVDVVFVGMYLSQRLYGTSVLYAVFLVMAVLGYKEWRSSLAKREAGVEQQQDSA
jgi:nicotinamide mononucleotide transporter